MKKLFALSLFAVILAIPAQAQNTPLKNYSGDTFHMKFVDSDSPVNIEINHSISDDGAKFDARSFTQEYSGSVLMVDVIEYDSVRDTSPEMGDAVIARSFKALDATVLKSYVNDTWTANGLTGREGSEAVHMGGKDYLIVQRVVVKGRRCYIIVALILVNSQLSGGDVRKIFDSFGVE